MSNDAEDCFFDVPFCRVESNNNIYPVFKNIAESEDNKVTVKESKLNHSATPSHPTSQRLV